MRWGDDMWGKKKGGGCKMDIPSLQQVFHYCYFNILGNLSIINSSEYLDSCVGKSYHAQ